MQKSGRAPARAFCLRTGWRCKRVIDLLCARRFHCALVEGNEIARVVLAANFGSRTRQRRWISNALAKSAVGKLKFRPVAAAANGSASLYSCRHPRAAQSSFRLRTLEKTKFVELVCATLKSRLATTLGSGHQLKSHCSFNVL